MGVGVGVCALADVVCGRWVGGNADRAGTNKGARVLLVLVRSQACLSDVVVRERLRGEVGGVRKDWFWRRINKRKEVEVRAWV